ncbi:MAG: response regulator transcription factor [Oscillospiraceae bacterium]|nr:response regulator transcription factor [Oscillospiraceae bacterium]
MKKILVCEDEETIREFVIINLERSGYKVYSTASGEDALKTFDRHGGTFDVVLLDVMLPGIDGFAVCKKIREKNPAVGIIMLTARSQEIDKVNGLMLGADDYVLKPFSPSELIARVDAVYRRVGMISSPYSNIYPESSGPFEIDIHSRIATKNGVMLDLTFVEYQLMEMFLKNPGAAMPRERILAQIWGKEYFGDCKIVDVNIRRLRKKIEDDPSFPQYILTIWGHGYKWNNGTPEPEESEKQESKKS